MDHRVFRDRAERHELSGVYLFEGQEEYLKEETLAFLRQNLLTPGFEALNETILEDSDADTVYECALAVPFMCDKRLVIAKDPVFLKRAKTEDESEEEQNPEAATEDKPADTGDRIVDLVQNNPGSSVVILYMRGTAKKGKIYKLLNKQDRVVLFDCLQDGDLIKFIKQKCKERKCDITADAADALVTSVGHSMLDLLAEIEKLTAYKAQGQIGVEDVLQFASVSVEDSVFRMIDLMLMGQAAKSYLILNELLSRNEYPAVILSMITRQLRLMAHVKALTQKGLKIETVASRLGIKDWSAKRVASQAARADLNKLISAYRKSTQTDFRIKSGEIRSDLMGLHEMMIVLKKSSEK
ncbi:MAG: DNA polymerase III subunit delta [Clostridia bacterium]|nr:DNA polymerase III subunit delta [Clostridia bacterium]